MTRVIEPETAQHIVGPDVLQFLDDLRRINRWLGGHWVTRSAFRRLNPPERFTVLDVGAGSSANGQAIQSAWPRAAITSLDILPSHLASADGARVAADAFHLPFAARSMDYVYCSLFLHHFSDDEIVRLLTGFAQVARRGVVVVDLERHIFARQFLPATRWLFRWHPVTVHDGKLSVNAAFKAGELRALAARAGLRGARVARHRPWFRLSVVWGR